MPTDVGQPAPTRAKRVLVVGPTDAERARLVTALSGLPGELMVVEAEGADDAIAAYRHHHCDLLLITTHDVVNVGARIARAVRDHEGLRHTGVIFIDHQPSDDGALSVQCLEMGADDFLRSGAPATELLARVRAVLRLKVMTDELRTANHQLRILSMTDDLTGLANMRSLNQTFGDKARRVRKGETALAVVMMDLDHFKSVNDTSNHLVGSHVLKEVGKLLRDGGALGPRDVAGRYGGDEFIMLCEVDSVDEASTRAEAVRRMIEAKTFERDGCQIQITASLGVAWVPVGFTGRAEDIVKAADLMLYRSKGRGRNRVSSMILRYPADLNSADFSAEVIPQKKRKREMYG